MKRIWILIYCLLLPLLASAHTTGTSYLQLSPRPDSSDLDVQLSLHLRDVEFALGVDADGDAAITWRELQAQRAVLDAYVMQRLRISRSDRQCRLAVDDMLIDELGDGPYTVLRARAVCAGEGAWQVHSDLLFADDAQHRTLLSAKSGAATAVSVLTHEERSWQSSLPSGERADSLLRFIAQGIHHIWIGFDHLAFLLILLLPAVLAAAPAATSRRYPTLWRVVTIVSAFTLAHSITLALAVLGWVKLPERPVEVAIALSVIVAALANLHPRTRQLGPFTAFGFGLLHGFGFASALQSLNLTGAGIGMALAGFNLGVELGQLAVVAAVLPALHYCRRAGVHVIKAVPVGSVAVAGLGVLWLMQRLAM